MRVHDAGQDVAGEGPAAESVWSRGDRDADGGAAGSSGQLRDDGEAHRQRNAERDSGQSVLQRRELAGTLRHHGPGDLGADAGEDHALRVRRGHGRHDHRGGSLSQGKESGDSGHRRRSGRLDSLRHVAVKGREQAGGRAVQGRGNRTGQGSRYARHGCDRRLHDGERQGVVRDGASAHARRRSVRRRVERTRDAGRAARRATR